MQNIDKEMALLCEKKQKLMTEFLSRMGAHNNSLHEKSSDSFSVMEDSLMVYRSFGNSIYALNHFL